MAKWLREPSPFVLAVLIVSILFDLSGMTFGLFYEGIFYDNLAHFLTSFALVALAAELAQERGALPLTVPGGRALVAGAVVGFVGGGAWEVMETIADSLLPDLVYNPPLDTLTDMIFGTLGGAVGAWRTAAYLNRKPLRKTRR
ncbi:MAG TPA: hypothetical protein VKA73_02190 [Rubrobacter sp.]|nr:hypothetical protein [Rubrobacter sp.]